MSAAAFGLSKDAAACAPGESSISVLSSLFRHCGHMTAKEFTIVLIELFCTLPARE